RPLLERVPDRTLPLQREANRPIVPLEAPPRLRWMTAKRMWNESDAEPAAGKRRIPAPTLGRGCGPGSCGRSRTRTCDLTDVNAAHFVRPLPASREAVRSRTSALPHWLTVF